MNRKKIAGLPHGEAEGTGKWVKAYTVDGILVLDCFESRKYIGRYCQRKDGKYDFYSDKEQKWQRKRLACAYGNPWYWGAEVECNEESQKEIMSFTGEKTCYKAGRIIEWQEGRYNGEKAEARFMRKRERINALMDRIPVLPDGFYVWLNETVFEGREYMFKTSPTTWYCTACGKYHTSKKAYKNYQEVRCSRTGKTASVRNRMKEIKKRENAVIFQDIDDSISVARHFVAERVWSATGCSTNAYENVRYILGKKSIPDKLVSMSGNGCKKEPKIVEWFYGQHNEADEFGQEWWDSNQKNKRCNKEYCYPEGVKEALERTAYDRMRLETYARLGWKLQYNKMMIQRDACGFMEYLAKAGLKSLTEEASDNFTAWGNGFYDGRQLNIDGKNASEVLGIDMQRFHRIRQHDGGYRYLSWLKWEQKNRRNLPEKTIEWLDKNGIDTDDIKFISDRMTPVQVSNYLERQSKESGKTPHSLLGYWKDYLSMAGRLEMDVDDEIVYRTKNLLIRHDELVEMINSMNEDEQAEKMKQKFPAVEEVLQGIKERYEYKNDKYMLVVPSRIQDIMRDGRQLHHCAASSERYFERICKNETYIMFLRKKTRPLYAWYTLEVEPGGTVRQKRSEYNRQPEIEEVKKFIAEWQGVLKDRMKQTDRELAEKSRTMRLLEMEELKEKNSRFAGVLEADLMEVV